MGTEVPVRGRPSQASTGSGLAWVVFAALVFSTLAAQAQELTSARLLIAGTRLAVSPESQTVPFDTPTIVETSLEGFDAGLGTLPADLRVLGDFTGPGLDRVLTLETTPNQPFRIPPLSVGGDYQLDNIRLVQGDELLAFGEPRSAAVLVTEILVTRVTSRPLTLDEIRSYGIVIDDDNFKAFNFSFGFAIRGETVDYNVPVVWSFREEGVSAEIPSAFHSLGRTRFAPPIHTFALKAEPNPDDPFQLDPTPSIPPLPGAIVFPSDVTLLNQFFSVVLMVQNGAPEGDPLVIRDLAATIKLPAGLRTAETEPPTPLGVPVPVRVPGPDGELGTADDVTFLIAQASGEAEFLVEGRKEGTHIVEIDMEGTLDGLPGGVRRLSGSTRGAVLVRDPTFGITIAHPDVVRADEEYDLRLTVANTSNAPANLVSIRLPGSKLIGTELVDPSAYQQTIDTLLPGESEVVTFRLRSRLTGRVVSTSARSDQHISPTFDLTVGVGENGIPLSPTTIVLPDETETLPPELLRHSLGMVGLGFSLATASGSVRDPNLPFVTRGTVDERIYYLREAAKHADMGEDLFDALALLSLDWNGARDRDWEWDRLRRTTQRGVNLAAAYGEVFDTEAQAVGVEAMFDRFVETAGFSGAAAFCGERRPGFAGRSREPSYGFRPGDRGRARGACARLAFRRVVSLSRRGACPPLRFRRKPGTASSCARTERRRRISTCSSPAIPRSCGCCAGGTSVWTPEAPRLSRLAPRTSSRCYRSTWTATAWRTRRGYPKSNF